MLTTTTGRALLVALLAVCAAGVSAQRRGNCGQPGQNCCCGALDWENPRCCSTGLQCAMFAGIGFGIPANTTALCLPERAKQRCGGDGQPCCMGPDRLSGFISGTCSAGLKCIPSSTPYGSRAMADKVKGNVAAAVSSAAVAGTCSKATTCGAAYNPCGTAEGCADASCPGGFYCAHGIDSGAGDRCIPLPADAGKVGGPCLPNNVAGASVVRSKQLGKDVAPPFCPGSAVCFTPTGGDNAGFTWDKPGQAKKLATRIKGTKCVALPANCGKGPGSPCCFTDGSAITDKPLPSAAWGGDPCNGAGSKSGAYCEGSFAPLSSEPVGKCKVNAACGGDAQPCCRYSTADGAGVNCPNLGGPGAGYCNLSFKCRLCPKVAYGIEDMLRCA